MRLNMFRISLLSVATVFFSGLSMGAEEIKKADQLFDQRESGSESIEGARKLYLSVLKNSHRSTALRAYALDRYGRLAVWEGEIAKEYFRIKDPSKIFKRCIKATGYLKPDKKMEQTAEYTYWRSMCIGLWAANASKFELVRKVGQLREMGDLVTYGLKHFAEFDEYGFARIQAGILLRGKDIPVINIYHPNRALEFLEPLTKGDTNNYMAHILQADALAELHRREEARDLLKSASVEIKSRLKNGTLPPHLVAEHKIFLTVIAERLSEI